MKILNEKPPVWESVMELFKINVGTTIFTYGDTIYNPAGFEVPAELIAHEEVHSAQQGHTEEGAAKWWARYFQDEYFRMDQEARAYAVQYDWWCEHDHVRGKDRNWRMKKMRQLATVMSSPTYGGVVSVDGAIKLIRQFTKTK